MGEAEEGFPEHQRLGAEACCGGLVERLSCYAEEEVCVDGGVHNETESDDVWEVKGQGNRKSGSGVCHSPEFSVRGGPVGGVARVVVNVVVSLGLC